MSALFGLQSFDKNPTFFLSLSLNVRLSLACRSQGLPVSQLVQLHRMASVLCLLKREVTLSRELLDLDFLVASFKDVLPKLPISYFTKDVSDNAAGISH